MAYADARGKKEPEVPNPIAPPAVDNRPDDRVNPTVDPDANIEAGTPGYEIPDDVITPEDLQEEEEEPAPAPIAPPEPEPEPEPEPQYTVPKEQRLELDQANVWEPHYTFDEETGEATVEEANPVQPSSGWTQEQIDAANNARKRQNNNPAPAPVETVPAPVEAEPKTNPINYGTQTEFVAGQDADVTVGKKANTGTAQNDDDWNLYVPQFITKGGYDPYGAFRGYRNNNGTPLSAVQANTTMSDAYDTVAESTYNSRPDVPVLGYTPIGSSSGAGTYPVSTGEEPVSTEPPVYGDWRDNIQLPPQAALHDSSNPAPAIIGNRPADREYPNAYADYTGTDREFFNERGDALSQFEPTYTPVQRNYENEVTGTTANYYDSSIRDMDFYRGRELMQPLGATNDTNATSYPDVSAVDIPTNPNRYNPNDAYERANDTNPFSELGREIANTEIRNERNDAIYTLARELSAEQGLDFDNLSDQRRDQFIKEAQDAYTTGNYELPEYISQEEWMSSAQDRGEQNQEVQERVDRELDALGANLGNVDDSGTYPVPSITSDEERELGARTAEELANPVNPATGETTNGTPWRWADDAPMTFTDEDGNVWSYNSAYDNYVRPINGIDRTTGKPRIEGYAQYTGDNYKVPALSANSTGGNWNYTDAMEGYYSDADAIPRINEDGTMNDAMRELAYAMVDENGNDLYAEFDPSGNPHYFQRKQKADGTYELVEYTQKMERKYDPLSILMTYVNSGYNGENNLYRGMDWVNNLSPAEQAGVNEILATIYRRGDEYFGINRPSGDRSDRPYEIADMTPDQYEKFAELIVKNTPGLEYLLRHGYFGKVELNEDGSLKGGEGVLNLMNFFFKDLPEGKKPQGNGNKKNGSGNGYGYRSYGGGGRGGGGGGYYRGGGGGSSYMPSYTNPYSPRSSSGGGYTRGGGISSSSGGTEISRSAEPTQTNQRQNRVYNIMKNWSF